MVDLSRCGQLWQSIFCCLLKLELGMTSDEVKACCNSFGETMMCEVVEGCASETKIRVGRFWF